MFQNLFSKLSSIFGADVLPPPEYHLVEVIRLSPHKFKVTSLKLSNPVVLIHGRRGNFFLVMQEGNSQSLFVRGNNLYGELGIGEKKKPVTDLEEVFTVKDAEIKFVKSGGRHSIIVVRRNNKDTLYACGYNNYSQCGIQVSHKPGWIDDYDSDSGSSSSKEYIEKWTKAEWPPKKYVGRRRRKEPTMESRDAFNDIETTESLKESLRNSHSGHSSNFLIDSDEDKPTPRSKSLMVSFGTNTDEQEFSTPDDTQVAFESKDNDVKVEKISPSHQSQRSSNSSQNSETSSVKSVNDESEENWRIKFIECGACHTVIVTESNRIFVRGYNEIGMCGLGHTDHAFEWTELISPALEGEEIRHVATQCFSTIFLTASNNIYLCGKNMLTRRSGRMDCKLVPTRITYPFPGAITHLACGEDHILVVAEDSKLYGYGNNRHFELGFSSNHNRLEFERVMSPVLENAGKILRIACGVNNSILFSEDRKLRAFGEFFSKLDDDEYLLLDDGYLHDVTMLDDRFIFVRCSESKREFPLEDWSVIQKPVQSNKVSQAVEAYIPTPVEFQRRSHFEDVKKSPKKRLFDSEVQNETAQVYFKRPRIVESEDESEETKIWNPMREWRDLRDFDTMNDSNEVKKSEEVHESG